MSRPHASDIYRNGIHPCRELPRQEQVENHHNVHLEQRFVNGDELESDAEDAEPQMDAAVLSVVTAFRNHAQAFGPVDIGEALEEFWKLKVSSTEETRNQFGDSCHAPLYDNDLGSSVMSISDRPTEFYNIRIFDSERLVRYEYKCDVDFKNSLDQKDLEDDALDLNDGEMPWVCYVFLPGGSCFASRPGCHSRSEAQYSAAKIALMSSMFNEHPSRRITPGYIEKAVTHASARSDFGSAVKGFRYALEFMMGRTFMEYMDVCTILRLMSWASSLADFFDDGSSKNEVFHYCYDTVIDAEFRWRIALLLVEKERTNPGFLLDSVNSAKTEIVGCRYGGKELRFPLEKHNIASLALRQFRCGN